MISIYSPERCELGEGLFHDKDSATTYWFDINLCRLYWKSPKLSGSIEVDNNPSCILSVTEGEMLYLDSTGIKRLALDTYKVSTVYTLEHDISSFRCNDGVFCEDGGILFGTMRRDPRVDTGAIYRYKNGTLTQIDSIGIPNSFVELEDAYLISDSLTQKIYSYSKLNFEKNLWADFSSSSYTPDGAALSQDGFVYISFWDGSCLKVFDRKGNYLKTIPLPILRPTNCKFISKNTMVVTSANEGMTHEQMELYPHSGKTFLINLDDGV